MKTHSSKLNDAVEIERPLPIVSSYGDAQIYMDFQNFPDRFVANRSGFSTKNLKGCIGCTFPNSNHFCFIISFIKRKLSKCLSTLAPWTPVYRGEVSLVLSKAKQLACAPLVTPAFLEWNPWVWREKGARGVEGK